MKKIMFIFLFFFGAKLAACSYDLVPVAVAFQRSDMVASIKVIAEYSTNKKDIVKYKIMVLEQYKGSPVQEIYYDTMKGTSCESSLPKNIEMIIFAYKNAAGNYEMGPFSKDIILSNDKKGLQEKQDIIQLFNLLKKNTIPTLGEFNFDIYQKNEMNGLKTSDFNRKFAVFEVEFNDNGQVKDIKTKISFGKKADEKAKTIILKIKQQKEKGIRFYRKGLLVLSYHYDYKTFHLIYY